MQYITSTCPMAAGCGVLSASNRLSTPARKKCIFSRMEVKLTRTQEFDLYEFSEESLAEELNTENKEAEHVKDSDT